MNQKRIADYGIHIGELPRGLRNKITDVPGVRVGHCTIDTEDHKTGVTVLLPTMGNINTEKLPAAAFVLNGYGKSTGLMQIAELGALETPLVLTNTLNVGLVSDALVEYMLQKSRLEGYELLSINPVVLECNDSYLNNIQQRMVSREHVFAAFDAASDDFAEGDTGAGKGMSCHQLKGGIGSASRVLSIDGKEFTLGVLVQTNHGQLRDLTICGHALGRKLAEKTGMEAGIDRGSVIVIFATDLPLSDRQLGRICRRAGVGLARLGSQLGHGSGEIALGFSTANTILSSSPSSFHDMKLLKEEKLDRVFRAYSEAVEEAVLNSMITAAPVTGYKGHHRYSLQEFPELLTGLGQDTH